MGTFTFGRTTEDTHYTNLLANNKEVSRFQSTGTGIIDTISIWFKHADPGIVHGKAIVYSDNAGEPDALLGSSDELDIPASEAAFSWHNFTFTIKPSVSNGTHYHLGFICEAYINFIGCNTSGGARMYNADTYSNGASDPFGAHTDEAAHELDVHADCTETAGGPTVKKGSALPQTIVAMLTSNMLFSACNRFPKPKGPSKRFPHFTPRIVI